MLRSLIRQLCGQRPDTPQPLLDLGRYRDLGHQPGQEQLINTLKAATQDFGAVYLVVDALDECPLADGKRAMLLAVLKQIHGWSLPNVHMFVTSREEPDIRSELMPFFGLPGASMINLTLYSTEVDQDITTFVDRKIALSRFKDWPEDITDEIRRALIGKADGM